MRYLTAALLTAATVAGCDLTESTARLQRPGLLRLALEDSIDFVAPDTVLLNQSFSISVTTHGGSCDTKGPTDVVPVADDVVEFRPFDITEVDDGRDCPLVLQTFDHVGTLSRSIAGPVVLTLRGRDWNNLNITREKTVFVK